MVILIAVALIALTGPDSQRIDVNPQEIVSIRPQRGNLSTGIRCLLHTTDGRYIAVSETCETVRGKLEGK